MRYIALIMVLFIMACSKSEIKGESVDYEIDGKTYQGYYVDAGKNTPLVILIHDWNGLTDYEIKRSKMLSELGFSVFAIDLFGKGIRPDKIEDRRKYTGELYKDREKMRNLLYAAIEMAGKLGASIGNAVAAGYCFGGVAVLELARDSGDIKGFATFHGGLLTPEGQNYLETKGEVLVMHGGADSMISMDSFVNLARELDFARVPHEMIVYGGVQHAFTVFGDKRYDASADKRSWDRFIQFLNAKLK